MRLEVPYEYSGAGSGVLHGLDLKEQSADYGEQVHMEINAPKGALKALEMNLGERTACY